MQCHLSLYSSTDDVAIDWIGNNLYWTDAVWARIEVMNLDTLDRAEVLRTGTNTNPRAIAVDPTTRYDTLSVWLFPFIPFLTV